MNYVTEPGCGKAKMRGRFARGFAPWLKRAVALAAGGFVALALAPAASAQDQWPAKPIRMIVPFPPGSSPDLIARMLTDRLGAALGQPVVVENKPGAGGMVGTAPEALLILMRGEADRWGKVIKAAGVKPG
jgi:hypothetical protein